MRWKESIHLFENVEQQHVELDESIYVRVMITIDVNTQATRISATEAPKYWALIQNQRSFVRSRVHSFIRWFNRSFVQLLNGTMTQLMHNPVAILTS